MDKKLLKFPVLIVILLLVISANPASGMQAVNTAYRIEIGLGSAPLIFQGEDENDWSGYSVSPAGDVNQDGYDDILIGAPYAGPWGPKGNGKAYLILGRARSEWWQQRINLENADASFEGADRRSMSGRQNYTAGDVNGDGYDDFLITCWKYPPGESGKVYLFLGKPSIDWGQNYPLDNADISFLGAEPGERAGYYVGTAGDVNGDGLADFLITAVGDDEGGGFRSGTTYLILGRQAADWGQNFSLANADASFIGEDIGDASGRSASDAGDVNHDGYDDFLIGALYNDTGGVHAGKAYLILGRPQADWGLNYPLSQADASFVGEMPGDELGRRVATAGDVNGDGFSDFLFGASYNDQGGLDAGKAYLFLGRAQADWGQNFSVIGANASFVGEDLEGQAGRRVSSAGDINNDGYDDFMVGAPQTHRFFEEEGSVYLLLGRPQANWGIDFPLAKADLIYRGEGSFNHAGFDESSVGDFDADGITDLLVGAWNGQDNGWESGLTYVLFGNVTPVPFSLKTAVMGNSCKLLAGYYDLNRSTDITQLEAAAGELPDFPEGFHTRYDALQNQLYLMSLDGTTWLGPCTPGTPTTITNGFATLNCSRTLVTREGKYKIQIDWMVKGISSSTCNDLSTLRGMDAEGHDSGWVRP